MVKTTEKDKPEMPKIVAKTLASLPKVDAKVAVRTLLVVVLTLLVLNIKHYFVVAWVNSRPIWRYNFDRALEKQLGKQVLANTVSRMLILQEAQRQKISVSAKELNDKISETKAQVEKQGGKWEEILTSQGLTEKDLSEQFEIQMLIEKIVGKDIKISDEEIADYFKKNAASYPKGAKLEEVKESIRQTLTQQKIGENFQTWLEELKGKAKITYWLKL